MASALHRRGAQISISVLQFGLTIERKVWKSHNRGVYPGLTRNPGLTQGEDFPMRLNLFVSAFIGAASVLAAAEAMAQCTTKSIPLPDAALLTPPASGCAFQIATLNAAPSQLDYERQCHRDAGVILRDRLV